MTGPASEALMWEARAAAGRLDDLLAWADSAADPAAELYASDVGPPRVVLVDRTGRGLPEPPDDLVARPPHSWTFRPVPRRGRPPGAGEGCGPGATQQR